MNDKEKRALALGLICQLIEIQFADDDFESTLRSLMDNGAASQEILDNDNLWCEIKSMVRSAQGDIRQQELSLMHEVQNDIDDDFMLRFGTK